MARTDIHEKRLSHRAGLSSDELMALIEENAEEYALIVTDPDNLIINWSRGAEQIFGYQLDEVLGTAARLIFTDEDRDNGIPEKEYETAIDTGRAADERWHLRKDGSRFWANGSLIALRDESGHLRGCVKILRDFTVTKGLEDALRVESESAHRERARAERAAEEIAHLNARLRRAMAEAHHRIKNSFQMLSALMELQAGSQAAGEPLDYAKLALHVGSLSAIHDLLTQDAKTAVEFDYISSKSLLDKIVTLMRQTLQGRNIHAEVDDMPLPLMQATTIAPLLSEMVANAVKHGEGNISICLSRDEPYIRLRVSDEGPGFPAAFDPKSAARTGLELIDTLVHHDLRGDVRYLNPAEGGASVVVTFPISLESL